MQTHRETILQAAMAVMNAAGVSAFRSRAEAFARSELPAVVLKPGGEKATRLGNRTMSRTFRILVEIHAAANSATNAPVSADQAADSVIVQVHAALFASEGLGGIVGDLVDDEMQEPSFVDADETRVVITLVYVAIYTTAERSITTIH